MVLKFNNSNEYNMLRGAAHSAFTALTILLSATALSPALYAAQSEAPEPISTAKEALPAPAPSGLEALKAQMNALHGGLDNLRRLRDFFTNSPKAEDAILTRAEQLIGTLPEHENAGDAAWRIAAVASLTLESGGLADIDVDNAYRLTPGAIGWDLGPEDAQIHTGFTPVTPQTLDLSETAAAISGATALTDGITAVKAFEAMLPNGLYRVMIVRDAALEIDPLESPFGGEINLNGAPINSGGDGDRDRVKLTGGGEKVASNEQIAIHRTAHGLGIEGWAIVENGLLRVDFTYLPEDIAISAIIAEPFDIEKVGLNPIVMETLANALGDIAPAAGPAPRKTLPVLRFTRSGKGSPTSRTAGTNSKGATRKARTGAPNNRTSFASTRSGAAGTSVGQTASTTTATDLDSDAPAFEDRDVLVQRSISEGSDSQGMAIDLGALLDDDSLSGVFMCLAEPCADTAAIAPEPDLSAAAEALGDWLSGPATLPEDWDALAAVLAARAAGSEIAIVYEFGIDSNSWTNVELRASAGSGLFVWLDGDYIFGASETGAFTDDLNFEYSLELPDLPGGQHFLQVLSESHVAGQGFAFELRGTPVGSTAQSTTSVPEPGTLALFGLGLLGLCAMHRRRE
jgi:hypothetical protein